MSFRDYIRKEKDLDAASNRALRRNPGPMIFSYMAALALFAYVGILYWIGLPGAGGWYVLLGPCFVVFAGMITMVKTITKDKTWKYEVALIEKKYGRR